MSDPSSASPETIPVREAHRFDERRLEEYLRSHMTLGEPFEVRQMRGGQSNPTFLLKAGREEFILRKQPPGDLLPSAHAVDREFRVQSALAQTDVPVARQMLFCGDRSVIGTPFYVMERMNGRIFWSTALPELPREERRAVVLGMGEALARLHLADWQSLGLADYGKPGNYFSRQITRWSKQWEISHTRDIPAVEKLIEALPRLIPPGDEVSICHGDYRIDNLIYHPTEPRVIAIIDWELSTLGHPLADLAYNCICYQTPPEVFRGLRGLDLAALGVPTQDEYVAAYCARTGRKEGITPFHLAFSCFRLAVILEGVLARGLAGNASSAEAEAVGAQGRVLAEIGWQLLS